MKKFILLGLLILTGCHGKYYVNDRVIMPDGRTGTVTRGGLMNDPVTVRYLDNQGEYHYMDFSPSELRSVYEE